MLKLKEFILNIVHNAIFGAVTAYVWRIEWQVSCCICGENPQLMCLAGTRSPALPCFDHPRRPCTLGNTSFTVAT